MDRRTKRKKLEAMANQSVSPHEAEIARKKLQTLPPETLPAGNLFNLQIRFNGSTIIYTVRVGE